MATMQFEAINWRQPPIKTKPDSRERPAILTLKTPNKMNGELETITPKESPEVIEKRNNWGTMGVAIFHKETRLSLLASEIIQSLTIPTNISEVPKAEADLKEAKRKSALLVGERKDITSKFDDLASRLMLPEKSCLPEFDKAEKAIISIKQAHEAEQRKVQAKTDELKNIKEQIINACSAAKAEFSSAVLSMVNIAYKKALDTDVKPDAIGAFMNHEIGKVHPDMFSKAYPVINPIHNSVAEVSGLIRELFVIDSNSYVKQFREDLDLRFSDYSIAYANKAEALRIAAEETATKEKEIAAAQMNETIAAKLESSATPLEVNVTAGVKALKKSYEVDMIESLDNSILVMAAFVANRDKLEAMTSKVNKWDSFNVGQMKNYLGKLASNDNNFQPAGIIFKEVNKL